VGLAKVTYASYLVNANAQVVFVGYIQMCHRCLKLTKAVLVIRQLFLACYKVMNS